MRSVKEIRIIIDTNLWISFLIGKRLGQLLDLAANPSVKLIASYELFDEIEAVASREKFKRYFSSDGVKALFSFMQTEMSLFKLGCIPSVCRDPKDDYLLELARISRADFLVTGDKDLLSLKEFHSCRIVTAAELFADLQGGSMLLD